MSSKSGKDTSSSGGRKEERIPQVSAGQPQSQGGGGGGQTGGGHHHLDQVAVASGSLDHFHGQQQQQQQDHAGPGVPAVSIAIYDDGQYYGIDAIQDNNNDSTLKAVQGQTTSERARQDSSSSTTSDVDSYDDAASIASRLSQIVDEQEFLLLNSKGADQSKQSHSMGNLLLTLDGKQHQKHNNNNNNRLTASDQQQEQQEARSVSELAVNCLAQDGGHLNPSMSVTSLNESINQAYRQKGRQQEEKEEKEVADANNNQRREHQAQSFSSQPGGLCDLRNESSSSLCAKAGGQGQFQPERGNLKMLESSRQQAMAAALKLRTDSPGPLESGGSGGGLGGAGSPPGDLMLNIRRSAWKLDEFEQAFKPSEHSPESQRHFSFSGGGGGGDICGNAQQGNTNNSPPGDSPNASKRNILLRSFKRTKLQPAASPRQGVVGEGVVVDALSSTNPSALCQASHCKSPLGHPLNHPASLLSCGPSKRRFSHLDQPSFQLQQQQQAQVQTGSGLGKGGGGGASGNLSSVNLTSQRRDSRISMVSFASSLDSSQSAQPFGRLGELLSPSHRKKRLANKEPAFRGTYAAGDTPPPGEDSGGGGGSGGCCPSMATFKQCLPALEWLPAYEWGANFWGDLTAGLAVAVLNISTSLSAAVVAETDLGVAFRSSIINTLVYALLCSSRHTSFGSWSIMSQMLLDSVRRALSDEFILSRINLGPQASWSSEEYEMWHMNIIIMYTFLIGLVQLAAGLLNLGNILASFIPEALCSSMIAATAFTMAIGQLANMCGTTNKILWAVEKNSTEELQWADLENTFMMPLSITDLFAGLFRWIQQLALLVKHHDQINLAALVISIISVCLLALNQYYLQSKLRKLFKKDNLFLPFEMILLIAWILVSYQLDLPGEHYRVTTCGPISLDFSAPNVPNLRLFRELWFDSLATALISYTMVFIMARTYSNKLNYEINNNQELIACGAGNLFGGLFDALPATASFSRTAGQVESGGRTQMASLINCVALILMVRIFGHHVAQLPVCVMSATLFFGFVRMMSRCSEVLVYWRICKVDFAIWLVTFAAILTLDLVNGFVYGFIFSILTMLYRAQNRRCYLLGSIGSSADVYVPLAKYPLARELDHIKIFQFCGPIHYVCADLFERLLRQKTRVNVKVILKQQQQQQQQQQIDQQKQVVVAAAADSLDTDKKQPQQQHRVAETRAPFDPRSMNLPTHVILDFSMISFIDSAGIHVIKKIINDFQAVNITVMLASLASHVAQVVKSEPSLWQAHKDRFYVTLADAVHHALRDNNQQQQQQQQQQGHHHQAAHKSISSISGSQVQAQAPLSMTPQGNTACK